MVSSKRRDSRTLRAPPLCSSAINAICKMNKDTERGVLDFDEWGGCSQYFILERLGHGAFGEVSWFFLECCYLFVLELWYLQSVKSGFGTNFLSTASWLELNDRPPSLLDLPGWFVRQIYCCPNAGGESAAKRHGASRGPEACLCTPGKRGNAALRLPSRSGRTAGFHTT
jgi:hypothetical protein